MEDGGHSLFDFVAKAHRFIENGQIEILEWQRIVKIIFKQMIECIEYVHNQNICHFDISLENFLINDIDVVVKDNKLCFQSDDIAVKLCDFGYIIFIFFYVINWCTNFKINFFVLALIQIIGIIWRKFRF